MDIRKLGEIDMGINIAEIKNQNLKELATLVDNSSNGKTRGNGMIDDCELSVFIDKAKKFGMETECSEILGLTVTKQNNNIQKEKAEPEVVSFNDNVIAEQPKTVKKSEVNLIELKEKIHQKKSEIALISEKIYGQDYSNGVPKEERSGRAIIHGLGSGAVLGVAGAFLTACAFVHDFDPVPRKAVGWAFAIPTILGAIGGIVNAYGNSVAARKATENEEKHPKLMNELKEAQQELKALQKQYNEYA